ncbi:hypothetical protein COV18_03940 [Candidatus Woesearchaeota archaeon CG10_big_fil_rev_8_21_14_0_10_37_12]|nr:MAG: hypothetical protein COV18_03940 [Candidatus Woesearchaeota archaeon CG10_big_fil_rev_8_21_14_0_10_37_12]
MKQNKIIWQSLFLTILIFAAGILINHALDYYRISTITKVMTEHDLNTEAYQTEHFFAKTFQEESCNIMTTRVAQLKEQVRKVGEDLGTYSRFSIFKKKDYDYLKRKYFLLQLRFLALVQEVNKECNKPYLPILFFYEIDQDDSEKQGYVLQQLSKEYEQQIIILTLDKNYKDEPLVQLLAQTYNITRAPTIILENTVYSGLTYTGQLNQTIIDYLRRPDPYAQELDFSFTPKAAGINITLLIEQMENIAKNETVDPFARGDATLILGRLTNKKRICDSLQFYDLVNARNHEEQALIHETSASLGCGRNRNTFLRAAAKEWKLAGNAYRADLLEKLANGQRLNLKFDQQTINANNTVISGYRTSITPILPENATTVTIGNTTITLSSGDILISQTDRVYRDWLGGQIANPYGPEILVTFSERLKYDETELLPEIGWHEGARTKDIKKAINITHIPAVGTLVAKKGNSWYASDEQGIFRFEVPIDKLMYPTTRFLRSDIAVIIDSHGVNMLVEQAVRYNATVVLSDCDHPGKVYAAKYLSEKNISVICYPDKYIYLAIGHNLSLIGSPPTTLGNETITLGGRPIQITTSDIILAVNSTSEQYALWYYQTPTSYFEVIGDAVPINIQYYQLTDFNQMQNATKYARSINANIIATRVFNSNDYYALTIWLQERPENKAILFHTASYPYGQKLFNEYVNQTSFDDPNPVFGEQ